MSENQWSTSEKEPFLSDTPVKIFDRKAWSPSLVVVIWLSSQTILFAILGGVLVFAVQHAVSSNAAIAPHSGGGPAASATTSTVQEFGGFPVQRDHRGRLYVDCSSTHGPAEARAAGCGFDLFVNGWVPGPCFDAEKHDWFVQQRDYYFWNDTEKNHRVHQSTLLEGNLEYPELFVSFEEHYEHCRYLLNGTQRYAHDPTLGVLDIHMDEEHMNHCVDFLKESRDPYTLEVGVIAYFGYKKCFLPHSGTTTLVM